MSIKDLQTTVSDNFLSMVKQSLRIEMTADDQLLKTLIKAARTDVMGQIGEQIDAFYDDNETFNTLVIMETGHLYAHREAVSNTQYYEVPMAVSYLINSMKDEYRYQLEQQMKGESVNGQKSQSSSNADHA
ncbi:head-tail connector protein [Limosilactobacillus gastricus]|uniref:head-tail connector protein n=2 Tax=Limosilactobacillus gastricus TaxID=227942 RepID=UPI0002E0BFB8|nr:head-tail connector protein [Limosilactobacillus gastricus]